MNLNGTHISLAKVAFAAGAVFAGIAVFGGTIGVPLTAAAIFCIALGLFLA